jgi:hypothetical protein
MSDFAVIFLAFECEIGRVNAANLEVLKISIEDPPRLTSKNKVYVLEILL